MIHERANCGERRGHWAKVSEVLSRAAGRAARAPPPVPRAVFWALGLQVAVFLVPRGGKEAELCLPCRRVWWLGLQARGPRWGAADGHAEWAARLRGVPLTLQFPGCGAPQRARTTCTPAGSVVMTLNERLRCLRRALPCPVRCKVTAAALTWCHHTLTSEQEGRQAEKTKGFCPNRSVAWSTVFPRARNRLPCILLPMDGARAHH